MDLKTEEAIRDSLKKSFQRIDAYSRKSLDELLAITDIDESELLTGIGEAIHRKSKHDGKQKLSQEEQMYLAVIALDREVNNGGYTQFFLNTSLLRIGCPVAAKITEKAIEIVTSKGLDFDKLHEGLILQLKHRSLAASTKNSKGQRIVSDTLSSDSQSENHPKWETFAKEHHECDLLFSISGERIGGKLIDFVQANKNAILA
jgi:hypothetical protein